MPTKRKPTELDVIRLHKAVFYAYHGAITDEQILGGKYEVDADLYADLSGVRKQDDLQHTIDYTKVYETIRSSVLGKKYTLIETLAYAMADSIIEKFPNVDHVTVRVRKPHAPIKGVIDYVEAEVFSSRKRSVAKKKQKRS
jgi:dihydroneopterin aldolase